MADYYPLVAKAIAGLEKNTGEGRRVLYERARSALVAQLRGMSDPPLTEAEITRERLALEEAIRKVEAEAARRGRNDTPPRPDPARAPESARTPEGARDLDAPPRSSTRDPSAAAAMSRGDGAPPAERPGTQPRNRSGGERRSVTDEGLKGFRDVIAEAEALGDATAQGAKTAREVFAATPPTTSQAFDRLEPRVEPEGLRTPVRPTSRSLDQPRAPDARIPEPRMGEPRAAESRGAEPRAPAWPPEAPAAVPPPVPTERVGEPRLGQQRQGPLRQPSADDIDELPKRSRIGLVAAILTILIILGLGAGAFWQRDRITALVSAVRGPAKQAPKDAQPTQPKIPDRVGQPPAQQDAAQTPANRDTGPVAAVAQRVVLYEEDPADPSGKRYVGSAIWRTETVTPGPGAAPDLAVRADLEIPERRITMTFSLRRNSDQTLPASHTIEVTFNLPADFPFGGISNVPGILMKQAEQTRGAPLAGLAVKVTSGFFLIGLSAVEADMQRNLQLLKERAWFDIPIVYNNGRRAILALEKGNPGERAFEEAFKAWGQ
jgi:hypothetical protein